MLPMLATFGALLAQENFAAVTVLPFESCAVAENPSCWLGEMDAFRGVMLMVAGGSVDVDEDLLPPQLAREMLMVSKHIGTKACRIALRASFMCMILEASLAMTRAQKHVIRSVPAFNLACHT